MRPCTSRASQTAARLQQFCCVRAIARAAGSGSAPSLNLCDWPPERIAGFKALLKGGQVVAADPPAASSTRRGVTILRSLPHATSPRALHRAQDRPLPVLEPAGNRCRDLCCARYRSGALPRSKLAARGAVA